MGSMFIELISEKLTNSRGGTSNPDSFVSIVRFTQFSTHNLVDRIDDKGPDDKFKYHSLFTISLQQ